MTTAVRTRFAPSPTGSLHLGSVRTALFNWLFAKSKQGVFILRIEDTDRERLVEKAKDEITESLEWLGLNWDEGVGVGGPAEPYVQSERLAIYRDHAQKLIERGSLYPCWCSPERLEKLREQAKRDQKPFKYDRHCLTNPGDPKAPHVLRFKIPDQKKIGWDDLVHGQLDFKLIDLDDFVAIKSDNYPTYNFANVVDDHLMQISHVMRAEEFLPSTPKHLLIYHAFGWEAPIFVHVPTVLGADKAKLSKRHGAKSVLEYRDLGYLPEAIINFLALLGWNEGEGSTKEIYNQTELIESFSLDRIQKSPAVFDPERLNWLNGIYIRQLSLDELFKRSQPFWPKTAEKANQTYLRAILGLVQERLKYLDELGELTDFFFTDPRFDQALIPKQLGKPTAGNYLQQAIDSLQKQTFDTEPLEQSLRELAEQLAAKPAQLFGLLRLVLTGKTATPPLFETMNVLGKETCLKRLKSALDSLKV